MLVAAVSLAATPQGSAADELPASGAQWYCWYAPPTTLSCLLEAAPEDLDPTGVDSHALARLPPLVTDMRTAPGRLRGQQIDTPLFGRPFEMQSVALLARSVMCGSQARCEVAFTEKPDHARVAAILGKDGSLALK